MGKRCDVRNDASKKNVGECRLNKNEMLTPTSTPKTCGVIGITTCSTMLEAEFPARTILSHTSPFYFPCGKKAEDAKAHLWRDADNLLE